MFLWHSSLHSSCSKLSEVTRCIKKKKKVWRRSLGSQSAISLSCVNVCIIYSNIRDSQPVFSHTGLRFWIHQVFGLFQLPEVGFLPHEAEECCGWNAWQQVLLPLESKKEEGSSGVCRSIAVILLQSSAEESSLPLRVEAEQKIVCSPGFLSQGNGLCGPL